MQKIRVLTFIDRLGVGASYVQLYSQYMNKNYFDVTACGMFDSDINEEILRNQGIKPEVLHGDFSRLEKLFKEVDIFHFTEFYSHNCKIARMAVEAGVPVLIERNIFGYLMPQDVEKHIDLHLLVSKDVAWTYMRRAKMSVDDFLVKNAVLYEPIGVEGFEKNRPSEKEVSNFRSSLGIDDDATLVCRVGRPDIAKWSPFVIQMLWYLVRKIPAKLLIVGGTPGWVSEKVRKYHLEKNVIDFGVASEEELVKIYYSIDVLTHCSRIGESFGRTIGEAMAAKKPVVVNSTPWLDNAQIELVDNGITGFVANTPETSAEAVAFLTGHPHDRLEMGFQGYRKAKAHYDPRSNIKALEKYYVELLERKKMLNNKELLSEYKTVPYFPSNYDVRKYPIEYQKRLKNYFDDPSLLQRSWIKFKQYTQQRPRRGYILKDTHLHIPPIF
jgi:glycosyltransferase involved in cell wall biosynthesis